MYSDEASSLTRMEGEMGMRMRSDFTWMFRGFLFVAILIGTGCTSGKVTGPEFSRNATGGSSTPPSGDGDNNAAPPAPSSFTGTSLTSSTTTINWVDNSSDETGFKVYRSTSASSGFSLISTTAANVTTLSETGRSAETTYFYKITAIGAGGESSALEGNVTTLSATAPSNLVATAASSDSISLVWQDNATTETKFVVKRSILNSAGSMVTIATLPPNTLRYLDTNLHPGNSYFYQVEAFNGATSLDPSNIAGGTTYSGAWEEVGGSATGTGVSQTARNASLPDVATDSSGRSVAVWEQNVAGINQIYLAIFDPNVLDDAGAVRGWLPIMMNLSVYEQTISEGSITGFKTTVRQDSMSGNGFSLSAGDSQKPKIVYDSTRDQFLVVWQEQRSGKYDIFGRALGNASIRYNSITGVYQGTFSGTTVTDNILVGAAPNNPEVDDGFSTSISTWNISSTATSESMRPALSDFSGVVYSVWEEYNTTTRTWQILGAMSTIAAVGAYPAVPAVPAVAAIATTGGSNSNTFAGSISQAAATKHARAPTIAVGDATHIYVAWQSTDPVDGDSDISTSFSDGATFAAVPTVSVANDGSSQNPRLGIDSAAAAPLPYLAWEDNSTNTQFNIYALQGTNAGVFATTLTDGVIDSSDTTGTGISAIPSTSRANAQNPTVAVYDTTLIVAWQDTSSGKPNIYVKRFQPDDVVPGEDASWSGMDNSDTGEGISAASIGAFHPALQVSTSGIINLIWENNTGSATVPLYQAYLRRW